MLMVLFELIELLFSRLLLILYASFADSQTCVLHLFLYALCLCTQELCAEITEPVSANTSAAAASSTESQTSTGTVANANAKQQMFLVPAAYSDVPPVSLITTATFTPPAVFELQQVSTVTSLQSVKQ